MLFLFIYVHNNVAYIYYVRYSDIKNFHGWTETWLRLKNLDADLSKTRTKMNSDLAWTQTIMELA